MVLEVMGAPAAAKKTDRVTRRSELLHAASLVARPGSLLPVLWRGFVWGMVARAASLAAVLSAAGGTVPWRCRCLLDSLLFGGQESGACVLAFAERCAVAGIRARILLSCGAVQRATLVFCSGRILVPATLQAVVLIAAVAVADCAGASVSCWCSCQCWCCCWPVTAAAALVGAVAAASAAAASAGAAAAAVAAVSCHCF